MLDCHLFTWKPDLWHWETIHEDAAASRSGQTVVHEWSCGRIKNITPGSRGLLIRLGSDHPALIGVGTVATEPVEGPHWDEDRAAAGEKTMFISLELRYFDPGGFISLEDLQSRWPDVRWTPQQSGTRVPPVIGNVLESEARRAWKS